MEPCVRQILAVFAVVLAAVTRYLTDAVYGRKGLFWLMGESVMTGTVWMPECAAAGHTASRSGSSREGCWNFAPFSFLSFG